MQNIFIAVKRAVSCRQYLVITLPKPCHSKHIISAGRGYKIQILFFEENPVFTFFPTDGNVYLLIDNLCSRNKLCFIWLLQYTIGICILYAMWMPLRWIDITSDTPCIQLKKINYVHYSTSDVNFDLPGAPHTLLFLLGCEVQRFFLTSRISVSEQRLLR